MKNTPLLVIMLLCCIACKKDNPLQISEGWEKTLQNIDDSILDSRVAAENLYLITKNKFYNLKEGRIIEERFLEVPQFTNATDPVIGKDFICRTLNYDTIINLEFQPIKVGGNTYLFDLSETGDDLLTFQGTRSSFRNPGVFYNQSSFILAGIDYPSIQFFLATFAIVYDMERNKIDNGKFTQRFNLASDEQGGSGLSNHEFNTNNEVVYINSLHNG